MKKIVIVLMLLIVFLSSCTSIISPNRTPVSSRNKVHASPPNFRGWKSLGVGRIDYSFKLDDIEIDGYRKADINKPGVSIYKFTVDGSELSGEMVRVFENKDVKYKFGDNEFAGRLRYDLSRVYWDFSYNDNKLSGVKKIGFGENTLSLNYLDEDFYYKAEQDLGFISCDYRHGDSRIIGRKQMEFGKIDYVFRATDVTIEDLLLFLIIDIEEEEEAELIAQMNMQN